MKALVSTTRRLARMIALLALSVALSLMTTGVASAHPVTTSGGSYQTAPATGHALLIGIVLAAAAAVACALVVFRMRYRHRIQRPAVASPVAGPSVKPGRPKAA